MRLYDLYYYGKSLLSIIISLEINEKMINMWASEGNGTYRLSRNAQFTESAEW